MTQRQRNLLDATLNAETPEAATFEVLRAYWDAVEEARDAENAETSTEPSTPVRTFRPSALGIPVRRRSIRPEGA